MKLYPLLFEPVLKERIWGGQRLGDLFGKNVPAGARIGESWELADLPEGQSIITNGPLQGQTLHQILESCGTEITGIPNYRPPFPLLIKFLDAQDVLSVQVHPDAATCKRLGNCQPKTECWYIIEAAPQAVIYKGLKPGTTRQQFAGAIADGTCEQYLVNVPVQAGECHFLPSGTCHAIGAGLIIAEIQQPSDTTYRVFDWNRTDPQTGKPRALHIDEALESIHFDASGDRLSVETVGRLVDADEFKVDKCHQAASVQVLLSGRMRVLIILAGKGQISAQGLEPICFQKGQTLLIPAAFEGVMHFASPCHYLTVTI
ncbi:MAG: class I mannose-6-phosphate isomerase [Planctomycetaceae bacterium]|nr:class I mannose-6-phosphate isomerase [Planctomycetaceae bacterium]